MLVVGKEDSQEKLAVLICFFPFLSGEGNDLPFPGCRS
jgi:hypothetical protein